MAKQSGQFRWQIGASPPVIESHSDAKLLLLSEYLDRYFDVVCANPKMDSFRITLVDAFCGGGLFTHNGNDRFGSPLVMIEAVRRAEERINRGRQKPLKIDANFIFVDQQASAIEYLKNALAETGLGEWAHQKIDIRHTDASSAIPEIVQAVRARGRQGRSIFLLDQCGYSDVPHRDVRFIYAQLPKSEVIVTYAFGSIYDYMNNSSEFLSALAPIELSPHHLRDLLKAKETQAGRYFAGRLLGKYFQQNVGSQFASRFFLRSERSGRDMWLVHYSKVLRSRLVMSEVHWSIHNSVTQGEAGLDMVGFLPHWEDQIGLDFGFEDSDDGKMHAALMRDLPLWLERFEIDDAPTFNAMLSLLADGTAATEKQFVRALNALHNEGEIEVFAPSGASKRQDSLFRPEHRIGLPRQSKLVF